MHQEKMQRHGLPQPTTGIFTLGLVLIGSGLWLWSAINPHERGTWVIEQIATLVGIATVLWLARRVTFDGPARFALFALFCIHTIGTHYSYSLTPYEQFSVHLFGSSPNDWFDWERNHYDRFVHFAYGLLMSHPLEQVLGQRLSLPRSTSRFLCLQLILSTSALYELAEWGAAVTVGGDIGTAYLGTQGDEWDAQADIALAGLGWLTLYCVSWFYSNFRSDPKALS